MIIDSTNGGFMDYKFHATLQFNQALCKHSQLGGHTLSIAKFKQLPDNEKCSYCNKIVNTKFRFIK